MKPALLLFLGFVVVVSSVNGCASSRASTTRDVENIEAQLRAWPAAAEAGDIERYLTFVTDDVIMLPPNQQPLRGKKAVADFLRAAFEMATFDITVHPHEELIVTGDWAYARYRVQMTVLPRAGGASTALDRKYLDIWQRQPDGAWKCHRHMWNDN